MAQQAFERLKILMVCLGNICRSPTAEGVFRHELQKRSLDELFHVDSSGTSGWHINAAPDPRSVKAAARRGIDLSGLRGRQVTHDDLEKYDYIFAMDMANYRHLLSMSSDTNSSKIFLFLGFPFAPDPAAIDQPHIEVPDPYYSGEDGFELVLDLTEQASQRIIDYLVAEHQLSVLQQQQ